MQLLYNIMYKKPQCQNFRVSEPSAVPISSDDRDPSKQNITAFE